MLILVAIFVLAYAYWHWYWLKHVRKTIPVRQTNWLLWTHAVSLVLFAASLYLWYSHELVLRGRFSFRIISWIFLLTGIVTYLIGHKSRFNWVTKMYFYLFSTLPALAGIVMVVVPFVGALVVVSMMSRLIGFNDQLLYNDDQLRVESTFVSPMVYPPIEVYRKEGLFEKRVYISDEYLADKVDSVGVSVMHDSTLITFYYQQEPGSIPPIVIKVGNR